MFKNYKLEVENQNRKKIKFLRSNRGDEYFSMEFSSFEENGIIHQTSAPYTPPPTKWFGKKKERIEHLLIRLTVC